jgi:nucleoside-diphosphate-sugar epimerase
VLIHQLPAATAPRRVVTLGARGFLATRLSGALRRAGTEVLAIGSADIDLTAQGAADALASTLAEGDALVVLSALTPDRGKGIDTLMANLSMVDAICAAAVRVRPSHVIYVSSDAVYRETEALVDEDAPADSPSLYGTMHALRERMLMHALAATPLAILRPTLIFGAGDTHNSYGPNRFMRTAAKDGLIALFGEGAEQRDHVYVDDVIRLIQAVLSRRSIGILNVVTGQSISFGDMARKVAALAGNVPVEVKPRAAGPVLHRHYDPTALFRSFPDFRFTPRDQALAEAWQGHLVPA